MKAEKLTYRKRETWTRVPGHHMWAGSTTYFLKSPAHPYPNTYNKISTFLTPNLSLMKETNSRRGHTVMIVMSFSSISHPRLVSQRFTYTEKMNYQNQQPKARYNLSQYIFEYFPKY